MAAFDSANAVTKAQVDSAKGVPEIWADEIIASYTSNKVMAKLVRRISVVGKKGDAVNIPGFTRGVASQKAAATPVVIQTYSGTGITVALDQHWAYGRLIEDFATVQASVSLRSVFTEDAGVALAKAVDDKLHALTSKWQGGAGTATWNKAVIGSDGATLYTSGTPNQAALTDAGFRRVIQTLDDADVPMSNRYLVIPPSTRNTLMGIARFTEQAFVGEGGNNNTIRTGRIANVYGVDIYVSSACPTATGGARIAPMFHKDALVLCEQMKPRVQVQQTLEHLANLLVADTIFGADEYRDNAGVAIAVPA